MALSKLCFFATLIGAFAILALQPSDAQVQSFNALTSNAYRGPSSAAFLPVQSKNLDDLSAGKLLVASRSLGDPNFAKTVVLLVRYDTDGVLGLVLNWRTDVPLSRVLDQLKAARDRSDPAFLGGPMETQVAFALLRSTAKLDGAEQILSGVYLISTRDLFEKAVSNRPDPDIFHVYVGYAGWTKDQLQKEVEGGSWFIFQGDARTVFDSDPDSLWREMIQKTELKLAGVSLPTLDPRVSYRELSCSVSNSFANSCGSTFPPLTTATAFFDSGSSF